MNDFFSTFRRSGFDTGVSIGKLTKAMGEVLMQLPQGVPPAKDIVVHYLGLLGRMSKARDINTAWDNAKRQAARQYPDKYVLDGKVLRSAAESEGPREKLSSAGHRRLSDLAIKEGLSPDDLLRQLIAAWRAARKMPLSPKQSDLKTSQGGDRRARRKPSASTRR